MDIRILITFMASVLFLGGYSPVEACKCMENHPQMVYCNSNAVLLAKFLSHGKQSSEKGYNMKVNKVLKGSPEFKAMTFVGSMAGTDCELTITSEHMNKDYIFAVSSSDGHVSLGLCSFVKLLSELPPEQITGMRKAYAKGCGCEITRCAKALCPSDPSQCIHQDGDAGIQQQNMMCAPDGKGMCKWKKM